VELNIILAVLGLFAMISGGLKSRERLRQYLGGPGLGWLELLIGFLLLIAQGPGMAGAGVRISLGWLTGGVMLISNLYTLLRARSITNRRIESEGRRLYTQVKFQQALEEAAMEGDPGSAEDAGPAI